MCEAIVQDVTDDKKRFTCHIKMSLQIYRFSINAETYQINADSIKMMNQNVKEHDLFNPIGTMNLIKDQSLMAQLEDLKS